MKTSWLLNLSMAFDGSRFLSGDREELHVLKVPFRLTIDASPLAGSSETTVEEFLELTQQLAIESFELLCSDAVGLRIPDWETEPDPNEFVLVTDDRSIAWQLTTSGTSRWIDESTRRISVSWNYHFKVTNLPEAPQLDAHAAARALRSLLTPHANNPWSNGAVGRALTILDGGEPPKPGLVVPYGVDEVRKRLYYATSELAGGKLTGMGGFVDWVPVDHEQLLYTFIQAFAASTRPAS